jgi:hypothetical protein
MLQMGATGVEKEEDEEEDMYETWSLVEFSQKIKVASFSEPALCSLFHYDLC